ncbi:MAG: thioredoxin family protein [Sulfurovum sp.]|nr:thioredoxin family protein [Sulfurovum sp.]MCB4744655.1 thioredoxin family protein [Sulfurovum sp.]MCB4746922.1 thioredoxin family protein [Sulfurovum sp.]MCB4749094.1 thioredoxin family protein [Sulfurovum sp.]MCB4750465.1 thioredoxin family protein [Sulfurovum sp.]
MARWYLMIFLFSSFLLATDATQAAKQLGVQHSYATAIAKAKAKKRMLVMVLVKEHCRWCHKLVKHTLADKKVKARLKKDYVTLIVDKDDTYPVVFKRSFFPSILYIDPNTEKNIYENVGYIGPEYFLNDLKNMLIK